MTNLSEHFTLEELIASDTAKKAGIDNTPSPEAVVGGKSLANIILDPIRERWGRLIITSGFRCHDLNLHPAVNGAATSDHVWTEEAASTDFIPAKAGLEEVFKWICEESHLPFDQCFLEYKMIDKQRHYRCIHISWRAVSLRRQAGKKPTGGYGKIEWMEVA